MLTDCVDSRIIGSYIELGINTDMSVELLWLKGGCRIRSLILCNYSYIIFMFKTKYINFSILNIPLFNADYLFMYVLIISPCVHDMYHTR